MPGYNHIFLRWLLSQNSFYIFLGNYDYVMVPFGLAQASVYFKELMKKVLNDLPFAMSYLDDIIIYSKNTWTIYSKFSTTVVMQKYLQNWACVTSLPKKFNFWAN